MNLTQKELSAIAEQLGGEKMLIQKYNMLAQQTTDPQVGAKFTEISARHQEHYNALYNFLR